MIEKIVFVSILVFFGVIIGMFLTVLCFAAGSEERLAYQTKLVPIVTSEPVLGSHCLVQVTGKLSEDTEVLNALLIARYDESGWILDSYKDAIDFEVFAWSYLPEKYPVVIE